MNAILHNPLIPHSLKISSKSFSISALGFLNALSSITLQDFDDDALDTLDARGSLVLVHSEVMKLTLIKWPPGKSSKIHGHPEGGCIFKVLDGVLTEARYDTSDQLRSQSVLFKSAVNYIDDQMGFHKVSNNTDGVAYSIHLYTYSRY